jgi:capsular polysaccharide biosynthesis protein
MATTLTRKKLLISSVALIAVVSIAALSFVYASDLFKEQADTIVIPESSKDAES